jgi:allantoicase
VTVAADVSAATVTAKSGDLLEAIAEGALDTSFFTGNFPPYASVETTALLGYPSVEEVLAAEWTPLPTEAWPACASAARSYPTRDGSVAASTSLPA